MAKGFGYTSLLLPLLTAAAFSPTEVTADPTLSDPEHFRLELVADFSPLGGNLKAFGLALTSGEQGFPRGLYVTSGPAADTRSDRLVYISPESPGSPQVLLNDLVSNEILLFSQGSYPLGMLVSIPLEQRIILVSPVVPGISDGEAENSSGGLSVSTFASGFTPPFGPTGLTYGPDGMLYASDTSSDSIYRVDPNGSLALFAEIPTDELPWWCVVPNIVCTVKAIIMIASDDNEYGEGFIGANFNAFKGPATGNGSVFTVSPEGAQFELLGSGLDGIEFPAFGPGKFFGSHLFVPTIGGAGNGDGGVYVLDPSGNLTPFLTGLDAVSVAFDIENVFGGGMFVSDINDGGGAGRIWRVVEIPTLEIPTLSPIGLAIMALLLIVCFFLLRGRSALFRSRLAG